MSLKETLGLRSHREDPKVFWFSMLLLSLLLWLAGTLLSLLNLQGIPGLLINLLRGLAPCWALECSVLTWVVNGTNATPSTGKQRLVELQIFPFTAVLALLAQLIHSISPGMNQAIFVTIAGLSIYFIVHTAWPRLQSKQSFTTPEIMLILLLGVIASVFLFQFLDIALGAIITLQS